MCLRIHTASSAASECSWWRASKIILRSSSLISGRFLRTLVILEVWASIAFSPAKYEEAICFRISGFTLNANLLGIPKEGVGASNDAKAHFGPPKFKDARFLLEGKSETLVIHIHYL